MNINSNLTTPHVLSKELKNALNLYSKNILISDVSVKLSGTKIKKIVKPIIQSIEQATSAGDVVGVSLPHGITQALAIIAVILSNRVPIIFKENDTYDIISQKEMSLLLTSCDDSRFLMISKSDTNHGVIQWVSQNDIEVSLKINKQIQTYNNLPSDVGMILYTSGSTGKSHGVMIPAEGTTFLANSLKNEFSLDQQTTSTVILPLSHTMCINTLFFPTILSGGNSWFAPTLSNIGSTYRNILDSNGHNIALISDLLTYMNQEKILRNLPPATSIKTLTLSGGMISESDIDIATTLFPNAQIYIGYGLTEATRIAITCIQNSSIAKKFKLEYRLLEGVDVQIRDEQNDICKAGEAGNIFIRAKSVMKGYYNEDTTSIDQQGYLKSGDSGSLSHNGLLSIYGRTDGIIKINGERISTAYIENIAMNHEKIKQNYKKAACILAKRNGRSIIYIFLETLRGENSSSNLAMKELKQALKKKIKQRIEIVEKCHFPKSSNGKIMLNELSKSLCK